MNKFKVGDRVVLRDLTSFYHHGLKDGMIGTILEDHDLPYVKFDNFTEGHNGGGLSDMNDCWACYEGRLELLKSEEACNANPCA